MGCLVPESLEVPAARYVLRARPPTDYFLPVRVTEEAGDATGGGCRGADHASFAEGSSRIGQRPGVARSRSRTGTEAQLIRSAAAALPLCENEYPRDAAAKA